MSTPVPSTFVYVRQSLPNEEGIARQLARTQALAKARGWPITREFADDGASASKARGKGTAWAAMLETLKPGDRVLAVDLDRLTRTLGDLATLLDAGVVVVTVDGEVDLSSADGEFRATLLASLARFEVRRKSERELRANAHKAATGMPVKSRRLYGYETSKTAVREAEAAVVRRLFDHVAEGRSLRSALAWLEAEAVPPGTGKGWNHARLRKLLTNPHYCGRMVHQGKTLDAVAVPAIVSADTWETVNAILADPTRRTNPGRPVTHWLSRRAVCGTCGGAMRVHHGSYLCAHAGDVPGVSIRVGLLDAYVARAVARALLVGGPALFLPAEGEPGDVRALVAEHAANADRVREVLADRDDDLLPADVARERLTALRDERHRIEADLEAARAASSEAHALAEHARGLLPDAEDMPLDAWEARVGVVAERVLAEPLEVRRGLLEALVAVQVDPGRGLSRVRLTYLRTPSLNEDGAEDFDAE